VDKSVVFILSKPTDEGFEAYVQYQACKASAWLKVPREANLTSASLSARSWPGIHAGISYLPPLQAHHHARPV